MKILLDFKTVSALRIRLYDTASARIFQVLLAKNQRPKNANRMVAQNGKSVFVQFVFK
jgi:hypothetical protein